jgi:hypothetical protein
MFAMTRVRLLAVIGGAALAALLALAAFSSTADATHSWSNYHWGRTGAFSLQLDDNLTTQAWKNDLATASGSANALGQPSTFDTNGINDWTDSSVLDTFIKPSTNTKQCSATSGRVEVCNARYGQNGWLGLATVWTSGGHIVQGTAKMNDTYFNTSRYNTPAWRHLVMCQEVGHTFGLAHQDENNSNENLGTCMDYSSDPDGGAGGAFPTDPSNEFPNQHDYDQLEAIYNHTTDTRTTVGSTSAASALPPAARTIDTTNRSERGQLVHESPDGGVAIYVREFSGGSQVITRVIRAVDGTPALETNRGQHHHDVHDH